MMETCVIKYVPTHDLRTEIFNFAIGNHSNYAEINETTNQEYHVLAGAVTRLWLLLPVAENINDLINKAIQEVTGTKPEAENLVTGANLKAVFSKIEQKVSSDPALNEQFIDAKTAVETEIANSGGKESDATNGTKKLEQFRRFVVNQRFLDEATKRWMLECDTKEYNRYVLARAIIQVSNKPDQRFDMIKLYDDAVFETAMNFTIDIGGRLKSENCPNIAPDPLTDKLFSTLAEKIEKADSILKTGVETEKKKVIESISKSSVSS